MFGQDLLPLSLLLSPHLLPISLPLQLQFFLLLLESLTQPIFPSLLGFSQGHLLLLIDPVLGNDLRIQQLHLQLVLDLPLLLNFRSQVLQLSPQLQVVGSHLLELLQLPLPNILLLLYLSPS